MHVRPSRSPFVVSLALLLALAQGPDTPRLDAAEDEQASPDVERVLAHVMPDKRELAWTKVPWHATLWDAVIEAHAQKKPILLWAMNGHALACT